MMFKWVLFDDFDSMLLSSLAQSLSNWAIKMLKMGQQNINGSVLAAGNGQQIIKCRKYCFQKLCGGAGVGEDHSLSNLTQPVQLP